MIGDVDDRSPSSKPVPEVPARGVTAAAAARRRLRQAACIATARNILAVVELQAAERGAAEAVRLLQDRVEHRREIAGRAS